MWWWCPNLLLWFGLVPVNSGFICLRSYSTSPFRYPINYSSLPCSKPNFWFPLSESSMALLLIFVTDNSIHLGFHSKNLEMSIVSPYQQFLLVPPLKYNDNLIASSKSRIASYLYPPKFVYWDPNSQRWWISRWSLWEVIRPWEYRLHEWS